MDIDADRAQRLFQAVVTQALIDATSDPKLNTRPIKRKPDHDDIQHARRVKLIENQRKAKLHKALQERGEARRWLLLDEASFPEIVSLAGYNPDDIRERSKKLARAEWRKPSNLPEHALAA